MKMKKNGLAALPALFIALSMLLITACSPAPTTGGGGKSLTHIEVTRGPDIEFYFIGEELNLDGIEVTAFYSDNTSEAVTGYVVNTGEFNNSEANEYDLTVTYQGKTATFRVIVIDQLEEDQIKLAGSIRIMINGSHPSSDYYPQELWYCPEGESPHTEGSGMISILEGVSQWSIDLHGLDVTESPKFEFWVWIPDLYFIKTTQSVTLTEPSELIQGIDIDLDLFSSVTVSGTVATNNVNIKEFDLIVYQGEDFKGVFIVDTNEGGAWHFEFGVMIAGTELTFKVYGIEDDFKIIIVDKKNITGLVFEFDASNATGGEAKIYFQSPFSTNDSLYFYGSFGIWEDNDWYAEITDQSYYSHTPEYEFLWYLNGVLLDINPEISDDWGNVKASINIPANNFNSGWNFGTVIVVIDGTAFDKDFKVWK